MAPIESVYHLISWENRCFALWMADNVKKKVWVLQKWYIFLGSTKDIPTTYAEWQHGHQPQEGGKRAIDGKREQEGGIGLLSCEIHVRDSNVDLLVE